MEWRLHRGGRWRRWLGARFGGDAALGDRVWRRCLHLLGLGVLFYFVLPVRPIAWLSTEELLLAALAAVLVMESARHLVGLQLPTIRDHEEGRVASYAWFAIGLVGAVLLFPEPVAVAVVLGTAIVDPLIGELRLSDARRRLYPFLPGAVYAVLAGTALVGVGRWHVVPAAGFAVAMAAVAVAVERPKRAWLDDDITMTLVPGVAAFVALALVPGVPAWGP